MLRLSLRWLAVAWGWLGACGLALGGGAAPSLAVPTLDEMGLAALAVAVGGVGALVLLRRRK